MRLNKIFGATAFLSSLAFVGGAHAAGTLAGTSISNQANLSFSIGSVSQTPIASNTVSFVVDNKVNLILIEDQSNTPTNATPGGTGFIVKYKLTNLGNSPQDYSFEHALQATGTTFFGRSDTFDATNCQVFVDSAANSGNYEPSIDTDTSVDELAPDASKEIFLRCDMPSTLVNNDVSISYVRATTRAGGAAGTQGAVLAQTTGANTAGIDIVFADGAAGDDTPKDGKYSARGAFLIKAATISVVKSVVPYCDPVNFTNNPKNIPGAYVRYSVAVSNAAGAGASANLNTMTDDLDLTNLTFDPDMKTGNASSCGGAPANGVDQAFRLFCTGGTRNCTGGVGQYKTAGASDNDGFSYSSGTITVNYTQALGNESVYFPGEVKPGETVTFEFNAIVK